MPPVAEAPQHRRLNTRALPMLVWHVASLAACLVAIVDDVQPQPLFWFLLLFAVLMTTTYVGSLLPIAASADADQAMRLGWALWAGAPTAAIRVGAFHGVEYPAVVNIKKNALVVAADLCATLSDAQIDALAVWYSLLARSPHPRRARYLDLVGQGLILVSVVFASAVLTTASDASAGFAVISFAAWFVGAMTAAYKSVSAGRWYRPIDRDAAWLTQDVDAVIAVVEAVRDFRTAHPRARWRRILKRALQPIPVTSGEDGRIAFLRTYLVAVPDAAVGVGAPIEVSCDLDRGHGFETARMLIATMTSADVEEAAGVADYADARYWHGWTNKDQGWLVQRFAPSAANVAGAEEILVMRDRQTNAVVGVRFLNRVRSDAYYIGSIMGDDARGKGLGTEELNATLAFLHFHLGVRRVFAETDELNLPARKQMSKAGMTESPCANRTLDDGRVAGAVRFVSTVNQPRDECRRTRVAAVAVDESVGPG